MRVVGSERQKQLETALLVHLGLAPTVDSFDCVIATPSGHNAQLRYLACWRCECSNLN